MNAVVPLRKAIAIEGTLPEALRYVRKLNLHAFNHSETLELNLAFCSP
jgi:hypothetical protein